MGLYSVNAFAVDQKITELTEDATPLATDLLITVDDPSGTPINKKIQLGNIPAQIQLDTHEADALDVHTSTFTLEAYGGGVGESAATNDTAWDLAYAAAAAVRGTIELMAGEYDISDPWVISTSSVSLIGQGGAGNMHSAPYGSWSPATAVVWQGAGTPEYVIQVAGPIQGTRLKNFGVDCLGIGGEAKRGIQVDMLVMGELLNLSMDDCSEISLDFIASGTDANVGNSYSTITNVRADDTPIVLKIDGNTSGNANTCHNVFKNVTGFSIDRTASAWVSGTPYIVGDLVAYDSKDYICILDTIAPHETTPDVGTTYWERTVLEAGAYINDSDNNDFINVGAFMFGGGHPLDIGERSRSNYFYHVEGQSRAQTPAVSDFSNSIIFYDRSNGNPKPVVEDGARLDWTEGGRLADSWNLGQGMDLAFEGATSDAFETTVEVVDPTADNTISIPDETGTLLSDASLSGSGTTVASTTGALTDGNCVELDVNGDFVDSGGVCGSVGVDAAAAQGFLGAASTDGVLRTSSNITYTDGGDFVTLDIADNYLLNSGDDSTGTITFPVSKGISFLGAGTAVAYLSSATKFLFGFAANVGGGYEFYHKTDATRPGYMQSLYGGGLDSGYYAIGHYDGATYDNHLVINKDGHTILGGATGLFFEDADAQLEIDAYAGEVALAIDTDDTNDALQIRDSAEVIKAVFDKAGSLSAKAQEITKTVTDTTFETLEVSGTFINNFGQSTDMTLSLETLVGGENFCFETPDTSNSVTVSTALGGSEVIWLDESSTGTDLINATPTLSDEVCCKTGRDASNNLILKCKTTWGLGWD